MKSSVFGLIEGRHKTVSAKYVLIQHDIDTYIIQHYIPDQADRKSLRRCNKYLRNKIYEFVTKVTGHNYNDGRLHIDTIVYSSWNITSLSLLDKGAWEENFDTPATTIRDLNCLFSADDRLDALEHLSLSGLTPPDSLPALRLAATTKGAFSKLKHLDINLNDLSDTVQWRLSENTLFSYELSQTAFVPRLTRLDIGGTPMSVYWVLIACKKLQHLTLNGYCKYGSPAQCTQLACYAPVGAPSYSLSNSAVMELQALTSLELVHCSFEEHWNWKKLADADFPALKELTFTSCCFKQPTGLGTVDWSKTNWIPNLVSISLTECNGALQGVASLLHLSLRYIQNIRLECCGWHFWDTAELLQVAASAAKTKSTLKLKKFVIDGYLAPELHILWHGFKSLRTLQIGTAPVFIHSDKHLLALKGAFPCLEHLFLDNFHVTESTFMAWVSVQANTMPSLQALRINFKPKQEVSIYEELPVQKTDEHQHCGLVGMKILKGKYDDYDYKYMESFLEIKRG